MSNGIDETVMLLAAAKLAHQKTGIHDHPRNDQRKKDDAEKQQHPLAPVKNDPSNIERNRQRHQGDAQEEEEDDSSAAARDAHGVRLILPRSRMEASKTAAAAPNADLIAADVRRMRAPCQPQTIEPDAG